MTTPTIHAPGLPQRPDDFDNRGLCGQLHFRGVSRNALPSEAVTCPHCLKLVEHVRKNFKTKGSVVTFLPAAKPKRKKAT